MAVNSLTLFPLLLLLLLLGALIHGASSDTASDLTECGTQLVAMQTCITYVQGTAKAPTPDCCAGLKDVLAKSPKCLCVLVKDHDDPQLPIKINVTRALALPAACSAAANISACPKLLNLPPNSKEAEIFKQAGSTAQAKGSNSTAVNTTSSGTSPHPTPETSSGWRGEPVEREMVVVGGGLLLLVMHLLLFST
ncbi:hypothetical protein Cni_G08626 [Canna indica]|uniref:Bifunctional inhibitor/plant lipid transfer protein/seed storage helical domain-containing protein n=1 Tax=Canna indica TaxID=4628 RepID=A0AAQ3K2S7_9LILI|nr:hypothetical protein Cni_G08626 [Canna indica]